MKTVAITGRSGCGKSTVGSLLAQDLGRFFVDADAKIVELAGKSIPEIFAQDGEEAFRKWETQVLSELGKQSGLIIATGGGCVTRERNYNLLHQNGQIFWLKRNLDTLPTDGRPLSQANRLADLYEARKGQYQAFADFVIDNNGSSEETVAAILSHWEERT